jgi:hypothetical protein
MASLSSHLWVSSFASDLCQYSGRLSSSGCPMGWRYIPLFKQCASSGCISTGSKALMNIGMDMVMAFECPREKRDT